MTAAPIIGGASVEFLARQLEAVCAEVKELRVEVKDLRVLLDARHRRSARDADPADLALLVCVGRTIAGRVFTARELFNHAGAHPDLSAALLACDITSPRQLGKWLARIERAPVSDALRVERTGIDRDGVVWRVVVTL